MAKKYQNMDEWVEALKKGDHDALEETDNLGRIATAIFFSGKKEDILEEDEIGSHHVKEEVIIEALQKMVSGILEGMKTEKLDFLLHSPTAMSNILTAGREYGAPNIINEDHSGKLEQMAKGPESHDLTKSAKGCLDAIARHRKLLR